MPVVVHSSGHSVNVSELQARALIRMGDYQLASDSPEAPNRSDTKDVWVQWALDSGAAPDEIDGLTKPELIDIYG